MNIGILEQAQLREGSCAHTLLQETLDFAKYCDELEGVSRFWVTEHHSKRFACASPEMLSSILLSQTRRIKVGTGGIMLSHSNPYKIARSTNLLHTFYQDRLEIGIGHAPSAAGETFNLIKRFDSSVSYLDRVKVLLSSCKIENFKPWILASSERSSLIAAELGLPLVFAYFINSELAKKSIEKYKTNFKKGQISSPEVRLCISVVSADDTSDLKYLLKIFGTHCIRLQSDNDSFIPQSPQKEFEGRERKIISNNLKKMGTIIGLNSQIKDEVYKLSRIFGVSDILVSVFGDSLESKKKTTKALL